MTCELPVGTFVGCADLPKDQWWSWLFMSGSPHRVRL
jgi:hypothetical protein